MVLTLLDVYDPPSTGGIQHLAYSANQIAQCTNRVAQNLKPLKEPLLMLTFGYRYGENCSIPSKNFK